MRHLREKTIENRCKAWARRRGWWVSKYKTPGNRARPDDQFVMFGRHVYWEFKAQGEEPTPLQYETHAEMRAAGMDVRWTDNFAKFEREMLQLETTITIRRERAWLE